MAEEVKPRYTREQIAQMATETVTVPKYTHEQLLAMMNEAEGAPAQIVQPTQQQKIWTTKEIDELRINGKITDALMVEIKQAMTEGRIADVK